MSHRGVRALATITVTAVLTFVTLHGGYVAIVALVTAGVVIWLLPRTPPPAQPLDPEVTRFPPPVPATASLHATLAACACPRCGGFVHWVSAFQTWWCGRCGRQRL